jgi:hypothetical protein
MALGTSMLVALACDSGGTTSGKNPLGGQGGSSSQPGDTGGAISGSTGGASSNGTKATGGAISGSTGGAKSGTGGASSAPCDATMPTATGTLGVASGYVTAGSFKGYGYAWKGKESNATTCVVPNCGDAGCTPGFGATALCAAGVVTMDTSYNSIVGVGFNLNQPSSGGTGSEGSVTAGSTITVDAIFTSGDQFTGNGKSRIQLVTDTDENYCIEAGSWTPGTPVNIGDFNKTCWDLADANAAAFPTGGKIKAVDIVVPASDANDRPFSFCLTGFAM